MTTPAWQVYALRYATHERRRRDNFIARDAHDDHAMPLDYFVWVIVSGTRRILVDTGFSAAEAAARRRTFLRCPIDALADLGTGIGEITDVILTHLHYDHAGNLPRVPGARFHVQSTEMAYATGAFMRHAALRHPYSADDVCELVRRVFDERVSFHDGISELAPGVTLHHVGGHTAGMQVVRVHTRRGWMVLASDAVHYYENMWARSPYPAVFHVGEMMRGFERVEALAESPAHIIPGHDPLVRLRYPAFDPGRPELFRLDQDPVEVRS